MLWYTPHCKLSPTPFPMLTRLADNLETAIKASAFSCIDISPTGE
ncbi:MAG: hypothetical protein VW268_10420 [Rhodospirillaceae bacterium]